MYFLHATLALSKKKKKKKISFPFINFPFSRAREDPAAWAGVAEGCAYIKVYVLKVSKKGLQCPHIFKGLFRRSEGACRAAPAGWQSNPLDRPPHLGWGWGGRRVSKEYF